MILLKLKIQDISVKFSICISLTILLLMYNLQLLYVSELCNMLKISE